MIPYRSPNGAPGNFGEEEFQVQHAFGAKIPHAELSSGDDVDAREVAYARVCEFYGCSADVGEVFPFNGFEPSAVLLFGALPFGCAYGDMRVPVGLENLGERN